MEYTLISGSFNPDEGGIQTWSHYTAKYLALRNIPFTSYEKKTASIFDALKLHLVSLFSSRDFILTDWHRIINIIALFTLIKIRVKKNRVYIFFHGDDLLYIPAIKKILFNCFINNKKVYPICNSKATADLLAGMSDNKNISLCHPFLDFRDHTSRDRGFHAKKNVRVFTTVTRLAKRKNVINVLYALKRIKQEGTIHFHYYIAGTGPEETSIRDTIKNLGIEGSVTMLGFINDDIKYQLLSKSDLFILPSLFIQESIEGYGIVFIEANYHGVPGISGNTGGMVESVVDGVTGFHSDGSVDDLYAKIKLFSKTKFDRRAIKKFALKHDIRNDTTLIRILRGETGLNMSGSK